MSLATTTRLQQVRARRRAVMRVGFLAIVAASATACIFDQSDYKGGGRIDKGATAKPPESQAPTSTTPTTTTTTTSTTPDSSFPTTD
jgi:hypothetical protein